MNSKELFSCIISDLNKDVYFSEFKYRNSDATFYKQSKERRQSIELEHWSDMIDLEIRPTYGVKFFVLTKWFEKFSVKPINIQRKNPDIFFNGIEGLSTGFMNIYTFNKNGGNYSSSLNQLRTDLINCSKFVFDKYHSMEDFYEHAVWPIINGDIDISNRIGADWIFRYLKLSYIVDKKNYPAFKNIMLQHIEHMLKRDEPNVTSYTGKFKEIFSALED